MSFADLRTGAVIDYPFLWSHEAGAGDLDGRKMRPAAVGFRLHRPGDFDAILLFPITSKEAAPDRFAVEIPDTEKRRGGLTVALRLWIVLDELNEDVVGDSFHLSPEPPRGHFSRAFFLPLMKEFVARRAGIRGIRRR